MAYRETSFSPRKIQELLAEQGHTQEWLAEQTGYTPEMISRYMNGHHPITLKFALKASRVLGVPVHWLEESEVAA